ncbi:phytanoyl-CoA dioxygenase family protein [Xenorhabdus miraniensis]|uniref:Ectoine dioxygenase n=1 Tax=Xenorhabdus miraniensis TaxID=351674 RepID=A0A2D0JWJ2_9GAMM|nr:phytanoyl-CoA dioxygenase family protein [Xenorhabdus miraniensis]PHM50723.1 Ectoine dioxygenase [Xenorhabdus miraniensis]
MLNIAPEGFSIEQWNAFKKNGFLIIKNALNSYDIEKYKNEIIKSCSFESQIDDNNSHMDRNIVENNSVFEELIDNKNHIGFIYDIYGEMIKLLLSQFFVRPPNGTSRNNWHIDGPRNLPFNVFSSLPLRVKVGYWLTDIPRINMGNLIYIPGSHYSQTFQEYNTHSPVSDEVNLLVEAGDITLMWGGLWHRVSENLSNITRYNIFLEYGPSWIQTSDRYVSDLDWAKKLSRERRIIMRAYDHPNYNIKPPAKDIPIYLTTDGDRSVFQKQVPEKLRKYVTSIEIMERKLFK